MRRTQPAGSNAAARMAALGAAALALGVLVYFADRDPVHAMLMPALVSPGDGSHFGAAGGWLPAFTHVFAFSLFTAAVRPPHAPASVVLPCALWWAIDTAFELAQAPALAMRVTAALDGAPAPAWIVDALARYVQQGTFDGADLAAIAAGACAAAFAIRAIQREESIHAT